MKTLRVLILFLGISLAALSSAVFLTVASADPNSQSSPKIWTHETDYYNNIQLARHGQMGDCYNSPLYHLLGLPILRPQLLVHLQVAGTFCADMSILLLERQYIMN